VLLELQLMESEIQNTSGIQPGFLGFLIPRRRPRKPLKTGRTELLYRQMLVPGDALFEALDHEYNQDGSRSVANKQVQWRMNLDRVARITSNYTGAVAQWREGIEEKCIR